MPQHFLDLARQFRERAGQMRHIADGVSTRADGDELTRLASQYDNLAWKYEDRAFALMGARARRELQRRESQAPRSGDRRLHKRHRRMAAS